MDDVLKSLESQGFCLERETPEEGGKLVLRDLENSDLHPIAVDFLSGQLTHRRKQGLSKGQPLPKALGLKSLKPEAAPYVLDATAGLGVDSFMMACLGCRVRSVERSPVIFALLQDGLERLRATEDVQLRAVASRMSFEAGHARDVIASLTDEERPDVIYLDPMYPEEGRSKSALPKKGMQMFRRLIGDDADAHEVFEAARLKAKERVVVKRPVHAPPIAPNPTHSFEGKTARYDMYLVNRK